MEINQTDTAIESHNLVKKSPATGKSRKRVHDFILSKGPVTDHEISLALNMQVNRVCARRNELVELGLVIRGGTIFDKDTERKVITWKAVPAQLGMFDKQPMSGQKKKKLIIEICKRNDFVDHPCAQEILSILNQ